LGRLYQGSGLPSSHNDVDSNGVEGCDEVGNMLMLLVHSGTSFLIYI